MNTTLATWEDEDNNRHIQFSVNYSNENGIVEIQSLTPEKISFVCPDTNTCTRSVGIWTDTGRELIAKKLADANVVEQLKTTIASQNTVAPHITLAANITATAV